jgi:hypothetical protein
MARLAVAARAFSASPSAGAAGVAMVQGASRGIGLEFVSPPIPSPVPHFASPSGSFPPPPPPPPPRSRFAPSH